MPLLRRLGRGLCGLLLHAAGWWPGVRPSKLRGGGVRGPGARITLVLLVLLLAALLLLLRVLVLVVACRCQLLLLLHVGPFRIATFVACSPGIRQCARERMCLLRVAPRSDL